MGPWHVQRRSRDTSSYSLACAPRPRWTVFALLLGACSDTPPEVDITATSTTTDASASSTSDLPGTSSTTASAETTGVATGSASGDRGSSEGTTAALDGGSTSRDSTSSGEGESTGSVSDVGCADGQREDLFDEVGFPDIAACSGGFAIPGVGQNTPTCDRNGGDDGPFPDGLTCSIDDLCAAGWHLCTGREEVSAMGISDCGSLSWSTGFYATAQSGDGSNTCGPTGTNDVFGCGDVGYTDISGCAPLNRSTGNLCVELSGPWSCPIAVDEAGTLVKSGPDFGGALCCRD
ncbi:MAG: hypothetical protein AB1Z98_25830 [Nannocystaceae bacterium]